MCQDRGKVHKKTFAPLLMYWMTSFFFSHVMDKALFIYVPYILFSATLAPSLTCHRHWKKFWMTRRSSCWNDAGSDARWQQSKRRAGSILISTPPRCSSTQQTPATIPVCPSVSSHFLPRWLHHTLLLLHVSCDIIYYISFELCPCITHNNLTLLLTV